jgi:hypothetical protein
MCESGTTEPSFTLRRVIHPFHTSIHPFLRVNESLVRKFIPQKRLNVFTIKGESPFDKGE